MPILYMYIHKYNLFILYSITYMYAFRFDFLALDNQFVGFSLGNTVFHALVFAQLPVVFSVGMRTLLQAL